MERYNIEEQLNLNKKVYVTKEVWQLVNRECLKLKKKGIKISKAKLVCNLIIDNYADITTKRKKEERKTTKDS